ncbi:MAG: DNA polymerase/3'-5' exonuclease PolX [Phycisphaerales bacterium]
MSKNAELASVLESIARMLDVLGEDSFKSIAHTRAARAIEALPTDICTMSKEEILALEGIGKKLADKIVEFCTTGDIKEYEELRAKVPAGVLALMEVPGIGPKTASVMWKQGHIEDIPALERAIADGSLQTLPRMGAKTVEKIAQSLAFVKTSGKRLSLGPAWAIAQVFLERLRESPDVTRAEAAGSLRRGKESIGDIDILVALKKGHEKHAQRVMDLFTTTPGVTQTLASGESKASVRYKTTDDTGRWKIDNDGDGAVQIDLRVIPLSSWGSGLMYFTGSKEHNIRLRGRALDLGLTLNDWGLFPIDEEKTAPHLRGVKPVAGATEEEIYARLNLPWIPPEMREDRGECDLASIPKLVELADIQAELHAHTTASDGLLSLDELAELALKRGFHTLAVTDHSRSSIQANGLSVDRLLTQVETINSAKSKWKKKGLALLTGNEVDILADGTLDYDDKVLKQLDVVVASPHAALSQDPESCTKRLVKALSHPLVHILGHPTGRLVGKRKGLEPDMMKLIAAAKTHHTALEINAHWMRLDLRDAHVRLAVEAGCTIAIDCDVHAAEDYDNLRFGVMTARRGWCPKALCLNTWPQKKLHDWLSAKR